MTTKRLPNTFGIVPVVTGLALTIALIVLMFVSTGHATPAQVDPGVTLTTWMQAHGATVPDAWAHTIDDNHALICRNYANGYANARPGIVDEYGITVPLAEQAITATGFCS